MKRANKLYSFYCNYVSNRKVSLNDSLLEIQKRKEDIYNLFENNVFNIKRGHALDIKYKFRYYNSQCFSKDDFKDDPEDVHFVGLKPGIKAYINTYRRLCYKEFLINKEIDILKLQPFDKSIYNMFNDEYYSRIVQFLLKGHSYLFFPLFGRFSIVKRNRSFSKNVQPAVDWKQSLDLLNLIVKSVDEPLYNRFINGEIDRDSYIELSKNYRYTKEHPERPKYIVYYTDETNLWLWWSKKTIIKNSAFYRFKPIKYINSGKGGYDNLLLSIKSVDDIIESTKLGVIDKLHLIKVYDPAFTEIYEVKNNYTK